MSNSIDAVRRLAHVVARGGASALAFGMFRLYIAEAGATVSGVWVYAPGRPTPIKGFRRFAQYVADLDETSRFLNDLANAHDLAEREIRPPFAEPRVVLPPAAVELNTIATRLSDAARDLLAAASIPAPQATDEVLIGDDAGLDTLLVADGEIARRLVKRAVYTAGKQVLEVLDSWIKGAHENADAGSGSHADAEQFHADDVRNMVNDAMRELGAPEPYRPASP